MELIVFRVSQITNSGPDKGWIASRTCVVSRIQTALNWCIVCNVDPKLENLNVNGSADEITEYIDWFNFWIDTNEASYKKAIKGPFLAAVRKKTFALPQNPKRCFHSRKL